MNILVVDIDQGVQDYYTNLMESEFNNIQVTFKDTARQALEYLPSHEVDIVISETAVQDMDIFAFIDKLVQRHIPVIIISTDATERLIIETLRAGAMDFVSKNNIKLGMVPDIIKRCLLEADRWKRIQEYVQAIPHREAYHKFDQRARQYLQLEKQEQERNQIFKRGDDQENEYQDGHSYYINYLYLQLFIPDSYIRSMDERQYTEFQSRSLERMIDIAPRHGGSLWTRKEDAAFFAFGETQSLSALLAAIEMRAANQLAAFTNEFSTDTIKLRIGMAGSKTIYRQDRGQIYSEGLNLAAHLALYGGDDETIYITAGIFDQLNMRSRKYFFKVPDTFEGHTIYRFEYLA